MGVGLIITFFSFIGMEVFSWLFHKYVMHGALWFIHKTHHKHQHGWFEFNDIFTLLFGGIATLLIIKGVESLDYRFWMGCGISLYGLTYFVLHDLIIHKRIKIFSRPNSSYLKGLSQAHKDHHKSITRRGSNCFGLLFVPKKYFLRHDHNTGGNG